MPRPRSAALVQALALVARGWTAYAASKATGADQAAISRALRRDARPVCPHCGQPVRA